MADLRDNEQYVFDRSRLSDGKKTVLLLKLTDTSLKVLEDYQKLKNGPKRRGSISFSSNQGTISLPGAAGCREFKIQVTTLQDTICECIQHKFSERIESIGCIRNKVTIKATDDSYTATSDKMKQAEVEMKKVSTKVIEQKGLKQGKKVKIKTPSMALKKFQSQQQPDCTLPSRKNGLKSRSPLPKPSVTAPNVGSHYTGSSVNLCISNNSCSSSSGYSSSSQNSNSSSSSPGLKPTTKMSFREHVIHALAVRPYKKVELVLKLSKDGFKNLKDKIGATLQQVASMKENTYSLQRHIYNEVKEEWPLYSSADRDVVKMKLQQVMQRPGELRTPPKVTNVDKDKIQPTKPAVKRPILPEITDFKQPKIQRIAHSKRNLNDSKTNSPSSPSEVSTSRNSPKLENGLLGCRREQDAPSPSEGVSSTSTMPDYMSLYTRITNAEQKQRYKNVFNEEYTEYLKIHKELETVQLKFSNLKDSLEKLDKYTSEYEEIEQKVLDEYDKINEDTKYQAKKVRFQELHEKLAYIKNLVVEYDNSQQELSSHLMSSNVAFSI